MSLPFDPSPVALVAVAWAITYAVHSTILLCGAWLLERRFADKPELMSPIWKAAVLGGALSATLQVGLAVDPAFGRWSVAAEERVAATPQRFTDAASIATAELTVVPVLAVAFESDVAYEPVSPPDLSQPALASTLERVNASGFVAAEVAHAPAAVATESSTAARVALALFALWIIGGLAAVIGLVRSWLALRRVLHTRVALHGGALADAFARLRERSRGPRSVALSMSSAIRVPLATGVVHPEVVVPRRALAELAPSAQESMLAHELAHVVRRDPAWRLGLAFVQRVLFFQPLIGVALRRITQHAEYLADAWAARHTAEPLALARCLTEIAAWMRSGPPTPGPLALASGMAEPASILGRRVLRLVEPPPVAPRRHALALMLACLVVPALAWIAPAASWAHDQPLVIANGEVIDEDDLAELIGIDDDDDVRMVVIDGGRAQGEMDALQHREPSRAAAARSDDSTRKGRRQNRKAERAESKQKAAARREAEREIKQAFRTAKKRGELPDPGRIAEIVARARADAHEDDGPRRIIVREGDGHRIVVERDEHGFVVRKDGKVVVDSRQGHVPGKGKGHGHGHGAANGIDLKVLDENGNVVHIRIPAADIEKIQRDVQRDVARAMRELHGAREHIERERGRVEAERDRVRDEMHRFRRFPPGQAPRAPRAPQPPQPYGDIVPISPMPAPAPMPPTPPQAFYVPVPFDAPEAPPLPDMPVPEFVPLAPAPPAPPAPPSSRRRAPRAAPKAAPRARPDITTVALPPSA